MKNKILFNILMALVVISMFGFVSAEVLVSDVGVEYDSEINVQLDNFNWVGIFMKLNNMSETDNLLNNFSETEFKFIRKSSTRIVGEITKKGFDKLINDSRVDVVHFNAPVYATNNETEEQEEINDEIEVEKKSNSWLWIIVGIVVIIILFIIIRARGRNQ